jgi:hypothetical protein
MTHENEHEQNVSISKYKLRVMLGQAFSQGYSWAKIPEWYNDKEEYIKQVFKYLPEPDEKIEQKTNQ